ncbi:winged helix-turn-helix domain-containing protein [Desmonostoc muscorum LEGE 12446]|uniref:Transposase n=1 Tax=Desmonostoc muscorum LEGE 12446 TaxID=1828758 RepID=A0A8J7A3J9_DESMC|nr:winged helix-turn-helix domain-containing protein [Desmonostoc muscorum]MCF2152051.1 winged helix-turn-helix domain-containing protein [Desmonostoc muscorum LEGE 12446]
MAQVTQAFPHLDLETVKQRVKLAQSHWERQKWLVIYNAIADPRTAAEIALHVGVSKGFVRKIIQQYNRQGEVGSSTPGKGGRHNCYLSWEQEKELIDSFKEKARRGQVATAMQIKLAYEKEYGFPVHKTTIYRLLERHQWRKIVPRPTHPKKDPNAVDEFKKTFLS